ncbi:MAG: hypothetical protein K6E19_08340, partial [Lachnospiraceae bacterium]|nr:hypothetical protein [Lachnospiraceae bacterium]
IIWGMEGLLALLGASKKNSSNKLGINIINTSLYINVWLVMLFIRYSSDDFVIHLLLALVKGEC